MSSPSRTTQFEKLHKVLRKHYKPVTPDPNRPVLEHLLLACCLENAGYQAAEAALAALVHEFFDLNEVRVSTVRELSEVMSGLPDPAAAANRVKRVLQHVFEGSYAFDLEEARKMNLGPAIERLAKVDGVTPFCVAYLVQSALGGHSIPIDSGTMEVMRILDLVSEQDAASGTVPGLERAISKSKGVEFGSMLHQLGADFTANPYSPALHEILLSVKPDAHDRLPKRRAPRKSAPASPPAAPEAQGADGAKAPAAEAAHAGHGEPAKGKAEAAASGTPQPSGETREEKKAKEAEAKAVRAKKKPVEHDPAPAKAAEPVQDEPSPEATPKKPPARKDKEKDKPAAAKKKPEPAKPKAADEPAEKDSSVSGISKKKPR